MGNPENIPIQNYHDLAAWKKARALVRHIYEATRGFPKEEVYGLSQQMRKAAVSVPSNIAEGYGRGSRRDYVRFLQMARGSLYEVQTQLWLAQDLGYLTRDAVLRLMSMTKECSRLLHGLLRSLAAKVTEG